MLTVGVALSHAPAMFVPIDEWPALHKELTGDVPQPAGLADEAPEANAAAKERIDAGLDHLAKTLEASRPDAVIIVGDDQSEVFGHAFNPTLAVYCGKQAEGHTLRRYKGKDNGLDHHLTLNCDNEFGFQLATSLTERGFDPAVMTEIKPLTKPEGIGHAFTRPAHRLGLADAGTPIVPVFLNGYHDPMPTGRRCWELGLAIREVGRERHHRPGQRPAALAQRERDRDGQVAARGVARGDDVGGGDPPLQQPVEGGDPVVDLRRVRVLRRAAVVEHERGRAERLREVPGELAVARGGPDGEPAAVGEQHDPAAVGAHRQRPDPGHPADDVVGVGHVGGLGGGLVPLVEQAAQQPDVEIRPARHHGGPVGVEVPQGLGPGGRRVAHAALLRLGRRSPIGTTSRL